MRLRCISSMATRQLLARLAPVFEGSEGVAVDVESVGGVDAARRVAAGQPFDVVLLASDAIDRLAQAGAVVPASITPFAVSEVAIAVPAGSGDGPSAIDSQAALVQRLSRARAIGYSTGPSGTAFLAMLDRLDLRQALEGRLLQAPPGVPVGDFIARGEVDIGFQQRSELIHGEGITVIGGMPPGLEIVTTFTAAVCAGSAQLDAAGRFIAFLRSPAAASPIADEGMRPHGA